VLNKGLLTSNETGLRNNFADASGIENPVFRSCWIDGWGEKHDIKFHVGKLGRQMIHFK
jgi:hypothetical protein